MLALFTMGNVASAGAVPNTLAPPGDISAPRPVILAADGRSGSSAILAALANLTGPNRISRLSGLLLSGMLLSPCNPLPLLRQVA